MKDNPTEARIHKVFVEIVGRRKAKWIERTIAKEVKRIKESTKEQPA